MMEAGWSSRRVAHQLGRSDCVVRRCWDQWVREMSFTRIPGSGRPQQISRREDRHIWCRGRRNWTAVKWNQVVFSDESRFNLRSEDNRVRVWRPRGERLNPAFALQRHTTLTAGVMVGGAIAYSTRSPLVLIRCTMTAQRYVHDILLPHVLPLMQRLPGAILQQDNALPHMARVSQDCLCTVTTLPCLVRSSDLSPIDNIFNYLGRLVRLSTSLNELEARLQQIWNEMSQNIIQNLYGSMPDRIASCIHARRGSTGY
ncbi:transposable element Tcb2 transposase [Trichonephila clavipes]|uniref:Transposable element Tcb2 transposase n=1 Tax=Trichonephila clavipes TaxID=2585209 RepID=A0A8X6SKK0_TRICX|nr:transposable element Tcb2 transposase [Trichonephila clavipes]